MTDEELEKLAEDNCGFYTIEEKADSRPAGEFRGFRMGTSVRAAIGFMMGYRAAERAVDKWFARRIWATYQSAHGQNIAYLSSHSQGGRRAWDELVVEAEKILAALEREREREREREQMSLQNLIEKQSVYFIGTKHEREALISGMYWMAKMLLRIWREIDVQDPVTTEEEIDLMNSFANEILGKGATVENCLLCHTPLPVSSARNVCKACHLILTKKCAPEPSIQRDFEAWADAVTWGE